MLVPREVWHGIFKELNGVYRGYLKGGNSVYKDSGLGTMKESSKDHVMEVG